MNAPYSKESLAKHLQAMRMVERIRAKELVGMSDAEAWRRIQLLHACETPKRPSREWSGLVEQQALFHRKKI